jgi:hypothetical protein
MNESTGNLLDASKETDLEVKKTKYVSVSHHQATGQNHNIGVANDS